MKKLFVTALSCCVFLPMYSQVGIGTNTPNTSSVLELSSTNKAFIPPRMTSVQRDQIANPVAGMMIYNSSTTCVEIYRSGGWFNLCTGALSGGPIDGFYSSNEVEAASLIGYWPFDGSTNESVHAAAPIRSGGTSSFVSGRIGSAIHFNNGWLSYPATATDAGSNNTGFNSNDTLQHGFTVSLWVQVPDTNLLTNLFQLSTPNIPNWPICGMAYRRAGSIFDFNGGLGNVDGGGPHLTYADAFKSALFNDSLSWAFMAMTYDPADRSLKYYANGTLRSTIILTTLASNPFPPPNANAALLMIAPNYATIGTFESALSTPGDASTTIPAYMSAGITGNIDDIRFFKKTLTAQRINSLFLLGSQGR